MSENRSIWVIGVKTNSESVQNWVNEIKSKTTPALIPDSDIISVDSKTIVRLRISEYPIKPVSVQGKYYKRAHNSNHLLSTDEIADEHLKAINTSWDYYPSPYHTIDDIELDKVRNFMAHIERKTETKIALKPVDFLKKFEIIRNDRLTLGAYLLFAKDHCLMSDIQVGRFKSDITIIDSISLNTDLFTEMNEIIAFIRKHLMVEYIITGEPQRTDRFDYPLDAIREIGINMIVHRDYRSSSASIIKIFDDRIEFFNPGDLYGGLTVRDLLSDNYTSKTRNKLIAKAFKEVGLIERYGSGIKRIIDICANYGIISPKFKELHSGFRVTIFKEKINDPLNDRVKKIIALINENKFVTREEMAEKNNVSLETIKRDISKMQKNKTIKRIGSRKSGHWQIIE